MTKLTDFYDRVTSLVGEGKAVDVVYWDLSKAFDTISHRILLGQLAARGVDGVCRVKIAWVAGPENGGEWSLIPLADCY